MKNKIFLIFTVAVAIILTSFYFLNSINQVVNKEKENHSVAYDALQFLSSAAAFPNTDIPPAAYGKAWDFYVYIWCECS